MCLYKQSNNDKRIKLINVYFIFLDSMLLKENEYPANKSFRVRKKMIAIERKLESSHGIRKQFMVTKSIK